jgi:general secretion pathway protein E
LRSVLRHDPDVIMIGEIRDSETARIATQAALTGHLVLSTLHTNDAASSVIRLVDMGIEHYLVTSTIVGILAQRLVRMLCADCKQPVVVPLALQSSAAPGFELPKHIFQATGCKNCRGTGYRGRSVISELMVLDDALRQCILAKGEAGQLHALAVSRGMETLYQNGVRTVLAGMTSHDEIVRVAQDVNDRP